jgi:uncharacterized membrane protein
MEIIFWLLVAHFIKDAKQVSVWFAYLTSHAFVHAGLSALFIGVPFGLLIGLLYWIQDYCKCKWQYSPFICTIGHRYYKDPTNTVKAERHLPIFHYKNIEEFLESKPKECKIVSLEVDGNYYI